MAGRFITFEGGEGAGKSTQVARLAARLRQAGVSVIETAEPGGTTIAMAIRRILLSEAGRGLAPDDQATLFAAARADHVFRRIRPALAHGDWVLCDRFMDSTRAYQGVAGASPEWLERLEADAVGDTRPELTVLLDLPPEEGLRRVAARSGKPDHYERSSLAVHELRRLAFLRIAAAEPHRVVKVAAAPAPDLVAAQVWTIVAARFSVRERA